jgi:hypothetical protein
VSITSQIGFSQRIRLEWFQEVAIQINAGKSKAEVEELLSGMLKDKVSTTGEPERGNRQKIITILMRTWMPDRTPLNSFRADGLEMLRMDQGGPTVAIHWGMVAAAYPFWATVASQVGRLLALQGTVSALQVQRRMREMLGERETVSRATRRVLRSFMDWGILAETMHNGTYQKAQAIQVEDPRVVSYVLEGALRSREIHKSPFQDLIQSHVLFPFKFSFISVEQFMRYAPRVQAFRHGMDADLIFL